MKDVKDVDTQPMDGLVRWSPDSSDLTWKRVLRSGESGQTGWHEAWAVSSPSELSNFRVHFDFRRRSPSPNVSEVARGFRVASSRAGYVTDVSDRAMSDGSQWVEYAFPLQGERGIKKIMAVDGGVVTATLSTSTPQKGKDLEEEKWNSLVREVSAIEFDSSGASDEKGGKSNDG